MIVLDTYDVSCLVCKYRLILSMLYLLCQDMMDYLICFM